MDALPHFLRFDLTIENISSFLIKFDLGLLLYLFIITNLMLKLNFIATGFARFMSYIRLFNQNSTEKASLALKYGNSLYDNEILVAARLILDYPVRNIKLPNQFAYHNLGMLCHCHQKLMRATTIPEPNFNNIDDERDIYQEIIDNFFVHVDRFLYLTKYSYLPKAYWGDEISYWLKMIVKPCHINEIPEEIDKGFMLLPYLLKYYRTTLLFKEIVNKIYKDYDVCDIVRMFDVIIKNTNEAETREKLENLLNELKDISLITRWKYGIWCKIWNSRVF